MKNKSPLGYKIVTGILVVIIVLLTAFMAVTLPTDWFGKGNPFGEMTGPEGPSDPDDPSDPDEPSDPETPEFPADAGYTIDTSGISLGNTQMVTGKTTTIDGGDSEKLVSALQSAAAGDTIILKEGTYSLSSKIVLRNNGAYNGYITVKAEDGADVVLDFSKQEFDSINRGIELYGDYWYWYGIEVVGAGDNGLYIGGNYNVVEYCEFHHNRDTGLQIGRDDSGASDISMWPSYNYIKNCTSYNNYDNETKGENADGFAAKLTVGYGNVFDGCIAYRNSDDGWDLYAKTDTGDIGAVIMYNCVAFENGYIGETIDEFNAKVNTDLEIAESGNIYTTQNGDGNGFKLGGSVMRGNVVMYNCMAFNNRMHGVTDNSNPGVISVDKITSYNNSAQVDATVVDGVEGPEYGQIIGGGKAGDDICDNINLARSEESYNNLKNVLSVADSYGAPGNDAYRGSVYNSIFYNGTEYRQIKEYTDAYSAISGKNGEAMQTAVDSSKVFSALPVTSSTENGVTEYLRNISGLENGDIHETYRNESDGSINMGDLLAVADPAAVSGAGAKLNLESWEEYEHYLDMDLSEAKSQTDALLAAVYNMLYLYTDTAAVYQDFTLTTSMLGTNISWSSSNEDILKINKHYNSSNSNSQDVNIVVNRPSQDTKVTLTAYINYRDSVAVKRFDLNIKAATYSLGDIYVEGLKGVNVETDRRFLIDQYEVFAEPELIVENGDDDNGKLLADGAYTVDSTYEYATSASSPYVKVGNFSASVAGVYRITHTVTYQGDSESFTYYIYVASNDAIVGFVGTPSFAVNVEGYMLSGSVTNVKGTINSYSTSDAEEIASLNALASDAEKIAAIGDKVSSIDFTDNTIAAQFENENKAAYTVYYWFTNGEGTVTSQVYSQQVNVEEIGTVEEYNAKLANNNSSTIYLLTADLDFSAGYTPVENLYGLFNGNGHTISNVTINGSGNRVGLFTYLKDGTIMNVQFKDISITGDGNRVAIIAESNGGYVHNVLINNISVNGNGRTAALIGQHTNDSSYNYSANLTVSQVAVINDAEHKILSSDKDLAGIVGLIQSNADGNRAGIITITDCYIDTVLGELEDSENIGGIVGRLEARSTDDRLVIERCYVNADIAGSNRLGGILGYHSKDSGAPALTIHDCVFFGSITYKKTLLTTQPEKNASGIIGGYIETADVDIAECVSCLPEHGYEDFVTVVGKELLAGESFWTSYVSYDMDGVWEYLAAEGEEEAPYPYIGLRFDGLFEYPAAEETPEGGESAQ